MSVSVSEIIRITHIPKVEGKHIFPVKKADRSIYDTPNLDRNATDYYKLKVGDLVNFMGTIQRERLLKCPENNYEIEIEEGFTIPVNRFEIEKIWVQEIEVDDKQLKRKNKIDENNSSNQVSKSHQAPTFFMIMRLIYT